VHVQYRDRAHRRAGILRARTGCSCVYRGGRVQGGLVRRGAGSQRRHTVPLCMSRGRGPTWILHACRGVRTVMLRSQSRGAIEGGRGVYEQGFYSGETWGQMRKGFFSLDAELFGVSAVSVRIRLRISTALQLFRRPR
jgi:hypothetical protein